MGALRSFKSRILALLALACTITPSGAAMAQDVRGDRDLQWIFREHHGDRKESPTAIFLAWDYGSIIFRASCQDGPGSIVLEYFPAPEEVRWNEHGSIVPRNFAPMAFERNGKRRLQPVTVSDRALRAEFAIDQELIDILAPADNELLIIAENIEGEPWYVGEAKSLYQLAKACR